MLKKQVKKNWLHVAPAAEAVVKPSLVSGDQDIPEVRASVRTFGRMHQLIILSIACILVYVAWRVLHDILLAKADNLFLKLPENANWLGLV